MNQVLIIGAGGIGGYFTGVLHAGGADVTLLARGANARAIRERGLRIENGPDAVHVRPKVVERLDPGEQFDLVLVATKAADTASALAPVVERLGPTGIVVALQNGLSRERLSRPSSDVRSGSTESFIWSAGWWRPGR